MEVVAQAQAQHHLIGEEFGAQMVQVLLWNSIWIWMAYCVSICCRFRDFLGFFGGGKASAFGWHSALLLGWQASLWLAFGLGGKSQK